MADGIFNQSIFNDDIFNIHAGAGLPQAAGAAGGQSKAVGARSLVQQQLGERPKRKLPAMITAKLEVRANYHSTALMYYKSHLQATGMVTHTIMAGRNIGRVKTILSGRVISEYLSILGEQRKARLLDIQYSKLRSRFFLEALEELKNGNSTR